MILVVLAVGSAEAIVTGLALWQETTRYAAAKRDAFLADARVLAAAVAPPAASRDRAALFQTLRAIGDIKGLTYVGVRDARGSLLGDLGATERLDSDVDLDASNPSIPLGALLTTHSIAMSVPIVHAGVTVGRLDLVGDTADLAARLYQTLQTALAGLAVALLVAALIAWRMQRTISEPLQGLTSAMSRVGHSHDYSLSLAPSAIREVGILIAGFNRMLFDIKERDARIAASYAHLEEQVAERTLDLRDAKEAAETANRQKSDFLATMSHEIRTPMNGMLVMAELLIGADLPPRARRYADVIARSGQSLLAIINDILDFSKIEAGKLDLESVPIDLAEAAGTVLDLFFEKARSQNLDLAAHLAVDLPARIQGDPVRLNQVLGNLINNALKFTETGGVRLDIGWDAVQPRRIRYAVTDTGIGIAADKLGTIFGAFSQADQSTTRRYGGTGLGLAICRRLVEAMGAEITVTSTPGAGSRFSFALPLDAATALAPEALAPEALAPEAAAWPRVGLRDGADPVAVISLAGAFTQSSADAYFRAAGYAVRALPAEAVAANLAGARLALLDARLCTPALRAAAASGCRMVALAAPGESATPGSADALLTRPLNYRDVRALIEADAAGRALETGAAAGGMDRLPGFAGARALVADDNAVNREVAAEALGLIGMTVELAEDGAEAVAAFEARPYDIIFMDGSMPVLDGFAATRRIRDIEQARGTVPVPIVALTAHVIGTASTAWMEAGMNGVLHKPFTLKALTDCIGRLLEPGQDRAAPAPMPEPAPTTEPAPPQAPIIDPKTFEELQRFAAQGRQDFVQRIVGLYLDHAPKAAQDIAARHRDGACEALAKSAHALKSMSLNIGARRVAALTSDIEAAAKAQILPAFAVIASLEALIAEACAYLDAETPARSKGSAPLALG